MKKKRSTYTESILQLLDLLVAGVVWNNSHRLADRLGDRLAACGKTPHKHSAPHLNESTKHKIPQEKLSVNLILSIPKALSQHTTPWLLQVAIHSFIHESLWVTCHCFNCPDKDLSRIHYSYSYTYISYIIIYYMATTKKQFLKKMILIILGLYLSLQ